VLWLILMVALLNLGLGYAAACSLGQGPPGLIEAWEALSAGPRRPTSETPETPEASEPSEDAAEPSAEAAPEEAPEPEARSAGEVEPSESARKEDGEQVDPLPAAVVPDHGDLDEQPVETSTADLDAASIEGDVPPDEVDVNLRAGQPQTSEVLETSEVSG